MSISNIVKGFFIFLGSILVGAVISMVYTSFTNTTLWTTVPSGLAKWLTLLIPLFVVIGGFLMGIKVATSPSEQRRIR